LKDLKITNVRVVDLRFPTSREKIGSDAVNKDPDYSAAYCILETDVGLEGHGLTFTLGRGTELCVGALNYLSHVVRDRSLRSITDDFAGFVFFFDAGVALLFCCFFMTRSPFATSKLMPLSTC